MEIVFWNNKIGETTKLHEESGVLHPGDRVHPKHEPVETEVTLGHLLSRQLQQWFIFPTRTEPN